MKIVALFILFFSTPVLADSITVSVSNSLLYQKISVGPSDTEISLSKISGEYQFSPHFSASFDYFYNQSSVKIKNLNLKYLYTINLSEKFLLTPNMAVGVSSYQESTPIQPSISATGLNLSPNIDLTVKLSPSFGLKGGVFYNFMTYSSSLLKTKEDNDIIIEQGGFSLGVEYSW